jgi:uncharacterized membrane protein
VQRANSVFLTLAAVFAALYAIGVVFLAPISFQMFQVRVADALLPLSMLFGWPAILGLTMGAAVANSFGGLGPVDVVGGAIANLVATFVAWRVARNRSATWVFVGVVLQILIVTLTVGSYLSFLFSMPLEIGWLGVLLGSVVAIGLLGSLLFFGLSRTRMLTLLRSRGIVVDLPKPKKQGGSASFPHG